MKQLVFFIIFTINVLFAIDIPKSTLFDKRVVYTNFNKDDVFQIFAKMDTQQLYSLQKMKEF